MRVTPGSAPGSSADRGPLTRRAQSAAALTPGMTGVSQLNGEGTAGQRHGHRIDISALAREMFGVLRALGS